MESVLLHHFQAGRVWIRKDALARTLVRTPAVSARALAVTAGRHYQGDTHTVYMQNLLQAAGWQAYSKSYMLQK